MRITFECRIETALSRGQLWALVEQSFLDSEASPIWPHALESIRSDRIETGAQVRAIYKVPGGLRFPVTYRLAQVQPGRQLRYEAEPSHPLRGGGTVELLGSPPGCVLHWWGAYEVPLRPTALIAAAFTKLYFTGRFFATLERRLKAVGPA